VTALRERALRIEGGGAPLEAALHEGQGPLAALVLHPHPLYGGDMDNHVVLGVCGALATQGATTLRFNFRGAGRSGASFDGGAGAAHDTLASLAALRQARPDAPLLLAGYSFGAMVAAAVAEQAAPAGIILISPPRGTPSFEPACPALLVTGEHDSVAPPDGLEAVARGRQVRTVIVAGADHGWWPGLDGLLEEVRSFAEGISAP
jgi:alpha/beta superfamily hydrolase